MNLKNLFGKNTQDIPKKKEYKNIVGECFKCGIPIHYIDQKCSNCGEPNIEWEDEEDGICFNCHAHIGKEKYCRWCGTKAGEGKFEPFQDLSKYQCIYGPMPVERTHTCEQCGFEWTTCSMIDEQEYCPKCGGSAPGIEEYDEDYVYSSDMFVYLGDFEENDDTI